MKNGTHFQGLIAFCFALLISTTALAQTSSDVKIGKQLWMSKNLDVSTFRNGEAIPEVKSKEEWKKAGDNKTAAFCYYEYDSKNGKVYGKLYNWYAVNDSRGLAPKGYHIPSDAEWTILTDFLGGRDIAGKKMKSKEGWECIPNEQGKTIGCNGNNSSGFSAVPAGGCTINAEFGLLTMVTGWWSSEEVDKGNAWAWYIVGTVDGLIKGKGDDEKNNGFSVRCIKD